MAEVEVEQGYSKWEWLFYIVLLPLLFTALLTGIILTFLGYNVVFTVHEAANKIPFLERIIPDPVADQGEVPDAGNGKNSVSEEMTTELKKRDSEIQRLQIEMEQKNKQLAELQSKNSELQKENEAETLTEKEHQTQLQQLSSLFGGMSPGKAAPIIENLTTEEAVLVLSQMKLDERGRVLEKMDPKKAADVSILLKDATPTKDREIAALQERVNLLTQVLSEQQKKGVSDKDLAAAYAAMDPPKAAVILTELYKGSPNQAIQIFATMDQQALSQILAEMDGKTASNITVKLLNSN
jgi:flagellar motility protein MotE (MotC chaperone)